MKKTTTILLVSILLLAGKNLTAQSPFERFYNFSSDTDDGLYVKQMPDNGFMVVGEIEIPGDTIRVCIIRTNAYGDTLWTKIYGEQEGTEPTCANTTNDGGLIICATASSSSALYLMLIKT